MIPRIRIGNQTAFCANSPLEPFEFALAQGFDAFEWFEDKKLNADGRAAGWEASDLSPALCAQIRHAAGARDMLLTVHAPWQANPLLPEGPARLKRSIEFARELGAALVNLHLYTEGGPGVYVESLLPVIEQAAQAGVRLTLENTVLTSPQDIRATFALLRTLKERARHVGLCLDIGHANVHSKNDFIGYIDALGPDVPFAHLHVHENDGTSDAHLTLFSGPAGKDDSSVRQLLGRLKKRGYEGALIMEQWPRPPELLVEADTRLRLLLELPLPRRGAPVPPFTLL